jgi:GAF domain-containing protein
VNQASREARASAAFVALADTLVSNFDLVELLHTLIDACTDLLDTEAGGLLLSDANGQLQLMASSIEDVDLVEVVQLSAEAGPCWDCFMTGSPITVADIEKDGGSWPQFQSAALQQGFRSMHATPMRLRGRIVGTMNLFHSQPGALSDQDIALAQSLTDVATIAILQARTARHAEELNAQLQAALDSRIVVEQAKGLLAHSLDVSMDEAFRLLRAQARSGRESIHSVAAAVAARRLIITREAAGGAHTRSRDRRSGPSSPDASRR